MVRLLPKRTPGPLALTFIFITVFLDVTGFGIIIPVLPKLLMELTGEGISQAAIWGGIMMFIYASMQFLFAPILGNLSDHFGRRPVLLVSMFGFAAEYFVMGIAPTITWLVIARIMLGAFGATTTTANAYIADVSPPEKRAANFGILGVAFGLGFIFGPMIGGVLGEYGPRVPFFVACGLAFANFLYGAIVLPETLKREDRRKFTLKRANPVGAWREMRRYPIVIGLVGALVLYQFAHDANPAVWTYYTMLKFDWSESQVGLSLAVVGIFTALVQGVLIRIVIPKFGEKAAAYAGLLAGALGFIGFALAPAGWVMLAILGPWALIGLAMPAMRGIMSNEVPDNAQGELQGAIASLFSVTAIFSPLFMTQIFAYFTKADAPFYFPGAPYLCAGIFLALAMGFVWRATASWRPVAAE